MRVSTATTKRLAHLAVWLALAATAFWALSASDFFAPSAEWRIVKPSDVQRYEKGYVSDRQRVFDVLEYRLELDVFPRVGALRGTARITGEATAALDAIDLNFEDSMAVRACRVNGAPTGFSKSGSRLSLAARLEAGERAAIEIEYLGFPTPRGFGSFVVRKWRGSWILSTLNEPQFAYSWFPCDDDPADKALFEAAITVDTAFVALTNGSPVGVERRGARATYRRRSAYPISTYLIALYVAPYREFTDRYVSELGDTLALRYHVLPGQIENARIDFADHPEMFAAFERAFGRYPFWEDGYAVAAFAWRGGMEHQTITAVGAELITGRDKIDLLLAHELAHQWWGNAVGPASWNDVWLNEGFATYAEAIYMESREGEEGLRRHMRRRFTTEFGGPLHSPPDGLFTKTTYWKGAWTLHALRGEVGDSLFFRILQDYFKTYRYGSATTEDFKAVCERVADREFGKFFDQFVYRGVGVIELAYDWRAEANDSAGGNETLVLNVQQTQAGYDAYDVRLTVEWRSEDGEPSRRDLRLDRRRQTFRIPIDKAPCAVALDPDERLPAAISERPKNNR